MSIPIGKRNLVVYGISGTAYGVKQNTDVVYREEYSASTKRAHLTHSNRHSTTWWIKQPDGTEKECRFGQLIPLRDGQDVTIIYVGWSDEDTVTPVAVFNAATKELSVYTARSMSISLDYGGSFTNGCMLPVLGFLAVPVFPFWASIKYGHVYRSETPAWIGFGVGLTTLIAIAIYTKRTAARGMARLDAALQTGIHRTLNWTDGIPSGVTVKTLEK
ncbi:hypothetical protein [Acidovorax sp. Leaf78]|uniref:hypothetical protein n=1 Tax=unclassified Acidovorax TaxID=2684926 RepID=UPI000AF4614B|nr:hypothetical protein [Acidovorax sp. Leaf78]